MVVKLETRTEIISFAEKTKLDMINANLNSITVEIDFVSVPMLLIKKGFLPVYKNMNEYLIENLAFEEYLLENYTSDEFKFWFGEYPEEMLKLTTKRKWRYATVNYWEQNGQQKAYSLPLLLYAPEKVYQISKRPKTDMSLFRNPDMTQIQNPQQYHLPVTRYAQGMSKGLYYKSEEGYCGTFYYYEPESEVLLEYNTFLKFPNKWEAMVYFYTYTDAISRIDKYRYQYRIERGYKYGDYWTDSGVLPSDLQMTPIEYSKYFDTESDFSPEEIDRLPRNKRYVGVLSDLYGREDGLDQEICRWARQLKIDVIILENMVGSHQIVSEILDTRPRKESFNNLVFPK